MGPSIIIDKNGTILIEPNCRAIITNEGDILIDLLSEVCMPSYDKSAFVGIINSRLNPFFVHRI